MKKEKASGFTLIELLAVIVILAIIAVIATPLAINVINDARKKSFVNSTYGLIDEAKLLSAEQLFNDETNEVVVNFTDGTADNTSFKVSGDLPTSGTLYLNSEGKVELKVWNEELGKCAEKSADDSEVKLTETTKENCKIKICPLVTIMGKNIRTCDTKTNDPDSNLRYVGNNPSNYVYFGKDAEGNKQRWRIIGVFDGKTKIRSEEYYRTETMWDDDSDGIKSNNWKTSSLQLGMNYGNASFLESIHITDPVSYNYIDLNHVWNIGGYDINYTTATRSDFYHAERSNSPAGATGSEATWIGAIGLIYPSDYGYASSSDATICDTKEMYNWEADDAKPECVDTSWLYDSNYRQWTLTMRNDQSTLVFYVSARSDIGNRSVDESSASAKPVLFLKPNIKIKTGKGTYDEPFELGI